MSNVEPLNTECLTPMIALERATRYAEQMEDCLIIMTKEDGSHVVVGTNVSIQDLCYMNNIISHHIDHALCGDAQE